MSQGPSCAICGVRMVVSALVGTVPDLEPYRGHLHWLDDVRVIGENASLSTPDKVYVSGKAMFSGFTFFEVLSPEEDSRAPLGAGNLITTYDWDAPEGLALPVHAACHEIMGKFHNSKLDDESLYRAMGEFVSGFYPSDLTLDYWKYEQNPYHIGLRHAAYKGQDWFVWSPTSIPELDSYYESLALVSSGGRGESAKPPSVLPGNSVDAFRGIPTELLARIMSQLDISSVANFRASSRWVASVPLNASFWKERLKIDQPWLYDFPWDLYGADVPVDWARVYENLLRRSESSFLGRINGLVNRRRIWRLCETLSGPYLRYSRKKAGFSTIPEILEGATTTPLRNIATPYPRCPETGTILLLDKLTDISACYPRIRIHWNTAGKLCGLIVQQSDGHSAGQVLGYRQPFVRTYEVDIDQSRWLIGIVTRSRRERADEGMETMDHTVIGAEFLFSDGTSVQLGSQQGDYRIVCPSPSHFVVGFTGQFSAVDGISKLALVQQPYQKLPSTSGSRVPSVEPNLFPDLSTQAYLWSAKPPAYPMIATTFPVGVWGAGIRPDASPMEPLVFGSTEEELADIKAVAVDVFLYGFEVQYRNRPPRAIGPRLQALQVLAIDGQSGERIATIFSWTVGKRLSGLCFVTNHGKQMVVGNPEGDRYQFPPPENRDRNIAGLFAFWSGLPGRTLSVIGVFLTHHEKPDNDRACRTDSNGLPWDGFPSPSNLTKTTAIYSQDARHNASRRLAYCLQLSSFTNWLDFRRPLEEVTVTFTHNIYMRKLPVVAIRLRYSDGSETSFGPTDIRDTGEKMGSNMAPFCPCRSEWGSDRWGTSPHFRHASWEVGGKLIRHINLWLGEGSLHGLQFATESEEGPKWGFCGEPAGGQQREAIELGVGDNASYPILKMFWGDNGPTGEQVLEGVQGLG
ncbi:hypothetical protein GQ53DRAFT_831729 [Thozetella sp. PMI_491]|nr:hypothetical protein GQ53DRAFT_831729 [Thozetella sp. PMI_491]